MISRARSRSRRSSAPTAARRSALAMKPADDRACAPTITLSVTVIRWNIARFWNVRPRPRPATSCVATAGERAALEHDVARLVLVEPAHAVEQGRLAGAVGADQAADVAAADVEADVVEGHDAAEAHADTSDAEQRRCRSRRLRPCGRHLGACRRNLGSGGCRPGSRRGHRWPFGAASGFQMIRLSWPVQYWSRSGFL